MVVDRRHDFLLASYYALRKYFSSTLSIPDGKNERIDNLCLEIYMRRKKIRASEFFTKEALALARE